jgi:hypothetical protein
MEKSWDWAKEEAEQTTLKGALEGTRRVGIDPI